MVASMRLVHSELGPEDCRLEYVGEAPYSRARIVVPGLGELALRLVSAVLVQREQGEECTMGYKWAVDVSELLRMLEVGHPGRHRRPGHDWGCRSLTSRAHETRWPTGTARSRASGTRRSCIRGCRS